MERCPFCGHQVGVGTDEGCSTHGCNATMHRNCVRKLSGYCPTHAKQQPACQLANCPNHKETR